MPPRYFGDESFQLSSRILPNRHESITLRKFQLNYYHLSRLSLTFRPT